MLQRLQRVWMYEDIGSQAARILMRGVAEGLRANGHEVHVFEMNPLDTGVCECMKSDLLEYDPDLICLANHPIQHMLKQIELDPVDCPVVVWLFDDPLIMGKERFLANEIALAADPSFVEGARQRGAERVLFVPVAAPEEGEAQVDEAYRFPVVYAGSVYVDHAMRKKIGARLLPVVRELIQRKLQQPQSSFEHLLSGIPIKKLMNLPGHVGINLTLSHELRYFLYSECNRNWRLRFLRALEPLGLHVFGNAAWKPYLQGTPLCSRFHRPIHAFTEYPRLVRSADIVININSLQGYCAPTLRDFQVPRFGGFQLSSRFHPQSQEWHVHDPHNVFRLDTFPWSDGAGTPEGLHEQTRRYQENPAARSEWTTFAREEILKHHTFAHRIQQVRDLLVGRDL